MVTNNNLKDLDPHIVWAHFATLCAIPHPSLHEAALREHLVRWAQARGIAAEVDDAGNLILKKVASPGCETMPGVILQGHLDMVCQANSGTQHDFEHDPIRTEVRDGWVVAENTTLGADNGIGVDVEVRHDCEQEVLPPDFAILRFDVSGLRGGHSGIDIHLGRGNAIKLLAEALHDLSAHTDMRLIEMNGGSARNAIPREAFAVCALPVAAVPGIDEWAEHRLAAWRQRFAETDANVLFKYELDEMPVGRAFHHSERDRLLAFFDIVANGVSRMSEDFPGVVDISDNLGVVSLAQGVFRATFKVRSLHNARANALADKMVSHAASYSLHAWKDGAYPGWTSNLSSNLLALCQQVYTAQFGEPACLQVIHAGLECGLLAATHPHLDMISFCPDIRGAHAPGESVEIESVARCWQLLKAVLQALATR